TSVCRRDLATAELVARDSCQGRNVIISKVCQSALTRIIRGCSEVRGSCSGGTSVPPVPALAFDELVGLFRAVAAGRVGTWFAVVTMPATQNRVDPAPGCFHLVAAHEQRRVALDDIEQEALVGLPAAAAAERMREVQI